MRWVKLTNLDIANSWLKPTIKPSLAYDYFYLEMSKQDWQDYFNKYPARDKNNSAEVFSRIADYQAPYVTHLEHLAGKLKYFFFEYLSITQRKSKVFYFPKGKITNDILIQLDVNQKAFENQYYQKQKEQKEAFEKLIQGIERHYSDLEVVDNQYQILNRKDKQGNPYILYPHQKEGADFLLSRKRALLDYEVGLGKSITALLACNYSVRPNRKALIICEKKLIDYWKEEARLQEVQADVINYEKCKKMVDYGAKRVLRVNKVGIYMSNYDAVIVDESHLLANFTQSGKAIIKILENFEGHIYSLTATPYRNSLSDYHYQMALLKHPLGQLTRPQFNKMFEIDTSSEPKLAEFKRIIAPIVISKTLADVGKHFKINVLIKEIEMKSLEKDSYKKIISNTKNLLIEDSFGKSRVIQDCVMKLQKLCSTIKVDWTTNFLKENSDKKVVVISNYNVDVLDKIAENLQMEVYKGATTNKDKMVKDFTDGDNNYFLAQRKIAQTGLNLQASETLLLHDLHWSLDSFIQSVGRIKRINQTSETLNVYVPVIKGTVEERVLRIIIKKMYEHEGIMGRSTGLKKNLLMAANKTNTKQAIKQAIEEEFLTYA